MSKRDFTSITDLNRREIEELFALAKEVKDKQKRRQPHHLLAGKTLAMVFEKASLRTRCAFELAMVQLGGHAVYLGMQEIGLGKRESIYDTAKNLERWFDFIMARTFSHHTVLELAHSASIPIINALSDLEHPCQALADIFTLVEQRGSAEGIRLSYVGDGNNVCHSLILLCSLLGGHIRVATPKGYEPKPEIVEQGRKLASQSGAEIFITTSPQEAVKDTEAVYTDVWASMGQEAEQQARVQLFTPYQVNSDLLAHAPEGVYIMHCLPAHRGQELTDEVMDSEHSIVFDQAENRLHTQKALLIWLDQQTS